MRNLRFALVAAAVCAAAATLTAPQAFAQNLLNGYWNPVFDEDQPERGPGPDQGDYAGLPVTPAAVSVAHTWDPERLTLPEL